MYGKLKHVAAAALAPNRNLAAKCATNSALVLKWQVLALAAIAFLPEAWACFVFV